MAGHFKQLTVWRKSIDFADLVYNETDNFPKHEQFELRSQMRRAAVSVPSNIAEGQAHRSHKHFIRFLRISRGSIAELQTQALIAGRRAYLSRDQVRRIWRAADEINKLIAATEKQLKSEPV